MMMNDYRGQHMVCCYQPLYLWVLWGAAVSECCRVQVFSPDCYVACSSDVCDWDTISEICGQLRASVSLPPKTCGPCCCAGPAD